MSGPSYELEATMGEDTYQVTVTPKCGKPVTLYVQHAKGESSNSAYSWHPRQLSRDMYVVKAGPDSPSYFIAHKTFEKAIISANCRARRIGRAFSKPLPRLAVPA